MRKFLFVSFIIFTCASAWGATITVGASGDQPNLNSALSAASAGDEIQLLEDITLDASVTINKAITLNLNNHMISGEQKYLSVGAYDITLCNGTLFNNDTRNASTTDAIALFVNSGDSHTLTLHDIEIIATRPILISTASSTVVFGNNVTLTKTFDGNGAATGKIKMYCQQNANLVISEGATMSLEFRTASKKTFNITNYGTLTLTSIAYGTNAKVLTVTNSGTLTTSASFTETTLTNSGTMTITDGTYNGATIVNNGTATITNAAFSTAATTFNGTNNTLITGGTFNVAPAGTKGYIEPVTNCTFVEGVGELTIADGYVWRESDGLIVVAPPSTVAATLKHLGSSQNYPYLEEAFAAAVSGDSIILMDDCTTSDILKIGTVSVSDASRTLVFDLNGHTLTSASTVERTILLMHGKLYVINSVPGQGGIVNTHDSGKTFFIQGTYQKSCNSRTAPIADLFTYLYVGEGVAIDATGAEGSSIVVDVVRNKTYGNDYLTKYINQSTGKAVNNGLANGVRVDVKGNVHANKYGIKINGYVSYPNPEIYSRANDDAESTVAESDTIYSTFVHVYPSANVTVPSNVQEAAPIYTGGYGRFLVEGICKGATGLYMKSGFIILDDAVVESTWQGNAVVVKGLESGIKAGGNAIVVESDASTGYPGHAVLVVNGDTKAQTKAVGGAALVDAVNTTGNSTIDKVTINGGTFIGDYAIVISEQTAESAAAEVVINGVSLVGDVEVAHETGVAAVNSIINPSNVHTTVVNSGEQTTIVVSAGSAPVTFTDFGTSADPQEGDIVDIAGQEDRPDANWTGTEDGAVSAGTTVALGELQIISGTSENGGQQLTIGENATLQVERLIMNEYATIIVEAGGTLIVDGSQGINAPNESNIIIKSSEEQQATFLFRPDVTSNRHPNASVKIFTNSKQTSENPWEYTYQRIALPIQEITAAPANDFAGSLFGSETVFENYLFYWNTNHKAWENCLWTAMVPFKGYQLANNSAAGGVTYTFTGNLIGNNNGAYEFSTTGFDFFGNSYTAPIYLKNFLEGFANAGVEAAVWIYDYAGSNYISATPDDFEDDAWPLYLDGVTPFTEIPSMEGFILNLRNNSAGNTAAIDYTSSIWNNPRFNPSLPAPKRAAADSNTDRIIISVKAADGKADMLKLNQGEQYSEAFDNGADASKYFAENGINLYATTANGDLSRVATSDLDNTLIGFRSNEATSYTLTIAQQQGEALVLRDKVTNATIEMTAGATYTFTQEANTTNPARFEVIRSHKVPTAVDNVEAAEQATGIYSITGQYVGKDFTTLPAGVYIVNGIKVIK